MVGDLTDLDLKTAAKADSFPLQNFRERHRVLLLPVNADEQVIRGERGLFDLPPMPEEK